MFATTWRANAVVYDEGFKYHTYLKDENDNISFLGASVRLSLEKTLFSDFIHSVNLTFEEKFSVDCEIKVIGSLKIAGSEINLNAPLAAKDDARKFLR